MYSKLDNKQKATLLEISDVANILAEAPLKLAEGFQYFLQVSRKRNDSSNRKRQNLQDKTHTRFIIH